MCNSQLRLTRIEPKKPTPSPSIGGARIERERTVDYSNRRVDILVELAEHVGNVSEREGVGSGCAQGPVSEIDRSVPMAFKIPQSAYYLAVHDNTQRERALRRNRDRVRCLGPKDRALEKQAPIDRLQHMGARADRNRRQ